MRISPLKHPLAVLRYTIGPEMTQKEMARLLNRSPVTIQKIELNKLPLAESLAQEISRQTGVSLEWLLMNDVSLPIIDTRAQPYTRERFEAFQALALTRSIHGFAIMESIHLGTTNHRRLDALVLRAFKGDKLPLLAYKLARAFDELDRQFGVNDEDRKAVASPEEWPDDVRRKIEKDSAYLLGYEREGFFAAMRKEDKRKQKMPPPEMAKLVSAEYEWMPDGQIQYYPEPKPKLPIKAARTASSPSRPARRRRA
jgi:transcriptional regulator with XRE-family HTH domain